MPSAQIRTPAIRRNRTRPEHGLPGHHFGEGRTGTGDVSEPRDQIADPGRRPGGRQHPWLLRQIRFRQGIPDRVDAVGGFASVRCQLPHFADIALAICPDEIAPHIRAQPDRRALSPSPDRARHLPRLEDVEGRRLRDAPLIPGPLSGDERTAGPRADHLRQAPPREWPTIETGLPPQFCSAHRAPASWPSRPCWGRRGPQCGRWPSSGRPERSSARPSFRKRRRSPPRRLRTPDPWKPLPYHVAFSVFRTRQRMGTWPSGSFWYAASARS